MHAKYEVYISNDVKVVAKVKVTDRQIHTETERQVKTRCPRFPLQGHKIYSFHVNWNKHNPNCEELQQIVKDAVFKYPNICILNGF